MRRRRWFARTSAVRFSLPTVVRDGRRLESHAWNRLPSGLSLDLTRDQFRGGEQLGPPEPREPLMLGDSAARHRLLAERVAAALAVAH